MHDNSTLVRARVARFVSERISASTYRVCAPLTVEAWEVKDEPVPFSEAVCQDYRPFSVGQSWGAPWGTTWFHLTGLVPARWAELTDSGFDGRVELVVDLGFLSGQAGFQAEGLVFDPDGRILKAIEPFNNHVPVHVGPGGEIDVYIEAASNPDVGSDWSFQPTPVGDKATAGAEPLYRLRRVEVAMLDVVVWELGRDIWTLTGLMDELSADLPRKAEILRAMESVVDRMDPVDVSGTAAAARRILAPLLARPAYPSAHRIVAVGHAHIDSAWLWPVRETIRKCARTFSNVLQLMDDDPDFVFACSSAQQFAWMKKYYPDLFERIRNRVAEGRFVPVGGMWVESDTNMPGGEALVRQFVAGKGFFIRELGVEPLEVWLPDTFGYSAALPQIAAAAGSRYFLTQKLSWNETNVFPHSTFLWEGIDGTRIFTHFPPVDTYNSELSGQELARAQRQYHEKGASDVSLIPFGYGDGGGGPTREMLAAAIRTTSLEGSPAVTQSTPLAFFQDAERSYPNPPVWSGELYLEFHRGTYTSQARTKAGNRRSEHLLREAELWSATATVRTGAEYPYERLALIWETVLLQQFHDILPGTSIAWVHQVAEANYARVALELQEIITEAIGALVKPDDRAAATRTGTATTRIGFNASPFPVSGVPAMSAGQVARPALVSIKGVEDGYVLENSALRVTVDAAGLVTSLVDLATGRDAVPGGQPGNLLQVFRDTPTQWDAWDVDEHYRHGGVDLRDAENVAVEEENEQRVSIRVDRRFGHSTVSQVLTLNGDSVALDIVTTVDWHEQQKLLKLAFPLDVHADRAASEIQFGHVWRPTHANTSWDAARFETCAHRWVYVAEPGFGIAIANDSTYGHDITRSTRPDGGTTTLVRQSLLRAPVFPDPQADQGKHVLRSAISTGTDILDAVQQGYRINLPLRFIENATPVGSLVSIDNPSIVVEAVKLAEDRSGDLVVRLYEARGARAAGRVDFGCEVLKVIETDLLERPLDHAAGLVAASGSRADLCLRPFQVITLRVRLA